MLSRLSRVHLVVVLVVAVMATAALCTWGAARAIGEYRAADAALRALSTVLLAQQQAHELQQERGTVLLRAATTGRTPDTEEFDRISGRIAELNQRSASAATEVAHALLRDAVRALEEVGEVKEAAAQTRGFLVGVLAAGVIEPQEQIRFSAIQAARQSALTHFDRVATGDRRADLHAVLNSAAAAEASRYEGIAAGASGGRLSTPVDPADWWTATTAVIDDLRAIQQALAEDIAHQAAQLQSGAVGDLGLVLVLGLTATTALLLVHTRRSAAPPNAADALVAEIHSTLLDGATAGDAWRLVADRLADLSPASGVLIVRFDDWGSVRRTRVAACVGSSAKELVGMWTAGENSRVVDVLSTGSPTALDDLEGFLGATPGVFGPSAAVPMRTRSRVRGVLLVVRGKGDPSFSPAQLAELSRFIENAAVALEFAENEEAKRWSAVLDERSRIAQDVYHLVIRRLVDAGMRLQAVLNLVSHPRARERVADVISQLDEGVQEMRTSIFELQVTADLGVRQRLVDLMAGMVAGTDLGLAVRIPKSVDNGVPADLAEDVEAVVREAAANVVRHAYATELALTVEVADDVVVCVVDNGIGIADRLIGGGLDGLELRAARRGGGMTIATDADGGTRLTWRAPLLPRSE